MTRLFFHAARSRCSQYLRTYKAQKGLLKKNHCELRHRKGDFSYPTARVIM